MANQKTLYSIAHTENGGETWDASPLSYPPLLEAEQEAFAGPVSLYFLDSSHGWLDVGFAGLLTPGRLLATDDGGHTWNWVNGPPTSGRIFFHSVGDGWLISDQGGLQLYVTHDGAKTWQETRLKAPSELGSPTFSSFLEMPMFTDSQNGYLALHYYGPGYSSPMLVVYATDSAGRSWQPVKTLAVPAHARVALTDSVVILPVGTGPGAPSTEAVSLAGRSPQAKPASRESENSILGFSFVDRNNGWALKTEGLFDTDDGGATWKRITPPGGWPTRVLGMCRSPRQGCPIHAASFGAWVGWPTAPVFP